MGKRSTPPFPLLGLLAIGGLLSACGGTTDPAPRKTVFDPGAIGNNAAAPVAVATAANGTPVPLEHPFPKLDRDSAGQHWIGVSILHDGVRFSRPSRWVIRDASLDLGRSYLEYVSPTGAYTIGIYERSDYPADLWRDVMQRYENDVATSGAKILGQRIPMATDTNQGRAYTITRKVDDGKASVVSKSREILLRSDHRVVLVQFVAQDEGLDHLSGELLEVIKHIEVL